MPKSKYAPALFEVIQNKQNPKSPSKFQLPKWWRNNILRSPEPQAAADPVPAEPSPVVVPVERPAAPVVEKVVAETYEPRPSVSTHREEVARDPLESFMRISVGDKTLVMSTVGATVMLGVLVVGLFATFGLGSIWGRWNSGTSIAANDRGMDEIEQALSQPPKPEVLKVPPSVASNKPRAEAGKPADTARVASPKPAAAPAAAKTTPPAAAAETARTGEGSTRVVLETFAGDHKESAEFAQKWLQSKKINTILEQRGNRWRLISADAFDHNRPDDAQRSQGYVDNVKSIGKTMSGDMVRAGLPNYLMSKPALERMDR